MSATEQRPVVASGERVNLGWFLPADFEAVHAFASDPRVCEYMTWRPNTLADTHRFLLDRMTPATDDYQLAILLRGRVIGSAGVWVTDPQNKVGELGYTLSPDVWGNGYATEVAKLLIEIGHARLELVRIAATCDVENVASARVLEKAGMVREGILRSLKVVRGDRRNHYLYSAVASA